MDRNLGAWVQGQVGQYRELVSSGLEGARFALSAGGDFTVSAIMEEVRDEWRIAATAALAGTVIALLADDRRRPTSGLKGFTLGGIFGLVTAVAWRRREMIGAAAGGALGEIDRTRNALWLRQHPINYA